MFVGRYGTFLTTRKNVPFPLNRRFCLRLKELVVNTFKILYRDEGNDGLENNIGRDWA